jgi:hypothetical protein
VREKYFLTLTGDLRAWQKALAALAERRGIYLEIQRGGWDSRRAYQKPNPSARQFSEWANAADLLKVNGAGWLSEAGLAFGKNPSFLPGGSVFKRLVEGPATEGSAPFGPDDLFAAHLLEKAADRLGFGRGATRPSRRQTRYLFYLNAIELIKELISRAGRIPTRAEITKAVIRLLEEPCPPEGKEIIEAAVDDIDGYMTMGSETAVHDEPALKNTFNSDLNAFLKWEQLGKNETSCPRYRQLLAVRKVMMGTKIAGAASLRDRAITVLYP